MTKKRSSTSHKKSPGKRSKKATPKRGLSLAEVLAGNIETLALIILGLSGLMILNLASQDSETPSLPGRLFGWGALPILLSLTVASIGVLAWQNSQRSRQIASIRLPRLFDWPFSWRQMAEMLVGLDLVLLAGLGLSHLWGDWPDPLAAALNGEGGGLAGWAVGALPGDLVGSLIAGILLVVMAGLGLWLFARPFGPPSLDWQGAGDELRALPRRLVTGLPRLLLPDAPDWEIEEQSEPVEAFPAPAPPQDLPSIVDAGPPTGKPRRKPRSKPKPRPIRPRPRPEDLPPLDILAGEEDAPDQDVVVRYKAQLIEQTLASFNVPVQVVDINIGPTVTQFGVKPGYLTRRGPGGQPVQRRVRVSRIKSLTNDLALALEAPTLRIEAPVPGKGYVGIEVPNSDTSLVGLRAVLESQAFLRINAPLAFALGRDVSGEPVTADLATMPHLLIAGATGSGKSVCINAIINSLLFNNGPDRLRLLLIDPKRVELPSYNGIPHLVSPVVTDLDQVVGALTWMTLQMDDRYRNFARVGARNLEDYNKKVGRKRKPAAWKDLEPYPYLVLIIDEMADLMMAAPDDVERLICRLAQMARATGLHLIIATQRPSVDVVTGLIKANFPARIAFAVISQTDSRVILDTPGADKLLGRGDMLFMRPDSSKLARIQGCFVGDREIDQVVRFWKEAMPPEELPAHVPRFPWTGLMAQLEDQDDFYDRALDLLRGQDRVSASWLQRRMRVGYNKAAGMIARMEVDGYVGPDEGAGRGREVLLKEDEEEGNLLF